MIPTSRNKQLETIIEEVRNSYLENNVVSYVFNPFTGQISSNVDKFCKLGTHLCITWTWFPLFENGKYIGYFAGDEVKYVKNGEFVGSESVNSYFSRKLMSRRGR
ncbi:MAG: hypothetical protein ABFD07_09900 [Methanobacterium sp.]